MQNMTDLRLAVLIDAENVPRKRMKAVMQELALYGTPTIKRIYGDWTSPNLASWKPELLDNAITPIQQYSYTVGKNSSDSALIIDAMDILYGGNIDGFCLVSSDSDFTRLATRLREAGMTVIGMGEKKTPKAFIAACDKFIYLEILAQRAAQEREEATAAEKAPGPAAPDKEEKPAPAAEPENRPSGSKRKKKAPVQPEEHEHRPEKQEPAPEKEEKASHDSAAHSRVPEEIVELLTQSVTDLADEDGYAFLGEVGNLLIKKQPDFDPRNFGFSKLTSLLRSLPCFIIDVRQTSAPNIKHIYVKIRE